MPCDPRATSHRLHFSFARTAPHPRAIVFGGASHPPPQTQRNPAPARLSGKTSFHPRPTSSHKQTFHTGPWSPNTSINSISHTSLLPATTILFHQPNPTLETQGSASMGEYETVNEREQGEGKKREGAREREAKQTPGSKPQVLFRSPRR